MPSTHTMRDTVFHPYNHLINKCLELTVNLALIAPGTPSSSRTWRTPKRAPSRNSGTARGSIAWTNPQRCSLPGCYDALAPSVTEESHRTGGMAECWVPRKHLVYRW